MGAQTLRTRREGRESANNGEVVRIHENRVSSQPREEWEGPTLTWEGPTLTHATEKT